MNIQAMIPVAMSLLGKTLSAPIVVTRHVKDIYSRCAHFWSHGFCSTNRDQHSSGRFEKGVDDVATLNQKVAELQGIINKELPNQIDDTAQKSGEMHISQRQQYFQRLAKLVASCKVNLDTYQTAKQGSTSSHIKENLSSPLHQLEEHVASLCDQPELNLEDAIQKTVMEELRNGHGTLTKKNIIGTLKGINNYGGQLILPHNMEDVYVGASVGSFVLGWRTNFKFTNISRSDAACVLATIALGIAFKKLYYQRLFDRDLDINLRCLHTELSTQKNALDINSISEKLDNIGVCMVDCRAKLDGIAGDIVGLCEKIDGLDTRLVAIAQAAKDRFDSIDQRQLEQLSQAEQSLLLQQQMAQRLGIHVEAIKTGGEAARRFSSLPSSLSADHGTIVATSRDTFSSNGLAEKDL